ncbi:MAG: hypothetical protein RBR74_08870, partial [Ignavibacteriaceae bacterium]|nr:hypothetical protein [Ignavibacteriaceae bacterium]
KTTFKELVKFGTDLRSLHLLESPKVNQFITTYPIDGSDEVEKLCLKKMSLFDPAGRDKQLRLTREKFTSTMINTSAAFQKQPGAFTSAVISQRKNG